MEYDGDEACRMVEQNGVLTMDDTTSTVLFTALARSGDYLTSSPPMPLRSSAIKIAIGRLGDDPTVQQSPCLQTTIVENPEHFAVTVIAADYTTEETETRMRPAISAYQ